VYGMSAVVGGAEPSVTGVAERSPDDPELVAAAQAGDRAALDALLRGHYDRLWAVSRQLTGDDADASDATQNAMMAIVRGLPRFDGRSRFGTWAYRVAVNASLDEIRRRRRRPSESLEELDLPSVDGGDPGLVSMEVDDALRLLPPDFRAAVVLRDLCGLDYAEIAEVLEIPPGTVRSRIARGRAALVPLLSHLRSATPTTEDGGAR
jgi:RNA polymerase sigma-70 factor, ECF subfamily